MSHRKDQVKGGLFACYPARGSPERHTSVTTDNPSPHFGQPSARPGGGRAGHHHLVQLRCQRGPHHRSETANTAQGRTRESPAAPPPRHPRGPAPPAPPVTECHQYSGAHLSFPGMLTGPCSGIRRHWPLPRSQRRVDGSNGRPHHRKAGVAGGRQSRRPSCQARVQRQNDLGANGGG